jgi:hypothetical protein
LIAPFRFEGYTNAENFNLWVEKILLPELKPNQVVVMDNASFNKNARPKELIESKNCQILYLPPYSPDLNPMANKGMANKPAKNFVLFMMMIFNLRAKLNIIIYILSHNHNIFYVFF